MKKVISFLIDSIGVIIFVSMIMLRWCEYSVYKCMIPFAIGVPIMIILGIVEGKLES